MTIDEKPAKAAPPKLNQGLKLLLEMGPLVLFFIANAKWGSFPAAGVLMAGVMVAMAASWLLTRYVAVMPEIGRAHV